MADQGAQLLEIGRVVRAHGLTGEVAVKLVTDREDRLAPGTVLYRGTVERQGSRKVGGSAAETEALFPAPAGFGGSPPMIRRSAGGPLGPRLRPSAQPHTASDTLEVVASQPYQAGFLVRFAGVGDRNAAEALRGVTLLAPALSDPEAFWVHELIGSEVVGVDYVGHGRVVAVEANPASDLLVLDDGGLVPLRFVVERAPGRLIVELPDGLLD